MCCASAESALAVKPAGIGHDLFVSDYTKALQDCGILPLTKRQLALQDDGIGEDIGGVLLAIEGGQSSSDGGDVVE